MSDTARSTATPASARPAPAATPASATPASATPFATPAQRLGNHCLSALLRARAAQAKLSVSHPSDAFELEADRVADQVMRMPAPTASESGVAVQRRVSDAPPELDRFAATADVPSVDDATERSIRSLSGRGRPLSPAVREFMEPRFNADFGDVRVHTDAEADGLAQSVEAQAFAIGKDLVFRAGHYDPDSAAGRRLLAHELAHVVQQTGGARDGVRRKRHPKRAKESHPRQAAEPEYTPLYVDDGSANEWLERAKLLAAEINGSQKAQVRFSYLIVTDGVYAFSHDGVLQGRFKLTKPIPAAGIFLGGGSNGKRLMVDRKGTIGIRPFAGWSDREARMTEWTTMSAADSARLFGTDDVPIIVIPGHPGAAPAQGTPAQVDPDHQLDPNARPSKIATPGRGKGAGQTTTMKAGASGYEFEEKAGRAANYPAFPAHITQSSSEVIQDGTNELTMHLYWEQGAANLLESVWNASTHVRYHWERWNVTNVAAFRGPDRQKAIDALGHSGRGSGEVVTDQYSDAGLHHRLDKEIEQEQRSKNVIATFGNPDDDGRKRLDDVNTARLNLQLQWASDLRNAGGYVVDSVFYSLTKPDSLITLEWRDEGLFLVRCIASPAEHEGRRYMPSVATALVEVRNAEYVATDTLARTDAVLMQLRQDLAMTRDPVRIRKLVDEIEALETSAHGSSVDALEVAQRRAKARLEKATARDRGRIEKELETIELQLKIARRNEQQAIKEPDGSSREHALRPEAALASEVTGSTFPLLLQLVPLARGTRQRWALFDVTTRGMYLGHAYVGEGRTDAAAIERAFDEFTSANQYGPGRIVMKIPAEIADVPHRTLSRRNVLAGGALTRERINDLIVVLNMAGLVVPGVGLAAGLMNGVMAVDRIIERYKNGSLEFDGLLLADLVAVLGAAGTVASKVSSMVIVRAEGSFALALRSGNVARLERALVTLRRAAAAGRAVNVLNQVVAAGGFAVGKLQLMHDLEAINGQEESGALTHSQAQVARGRLILGAFQNDGLLIAGLLRNRNPARPGGGGGRRVRPPRARVDIEEPLPGPATGSTATGGSTTTGFEEQPTVVDELPPVVPAILYMGRPRRDGSRIDRIVIAWRGEPAYVSSGTSRSRRPDGTIHIKERGRVYRFAGVQEWYYNEDAKRGWMIKTWEETDMNPIAELDGMRFHIEARSSVPEEINAWLAEHEAIPFLSIEHYAHDLLPDPDPEPGSGGGGPGGGGAGPGGGGGGVPSPTSERPTPRQIPVVRPPADDVPASERPTARQIPTVRPRPDEVPTSERPTARQIPTVRPRPEEVPTSERPTPRQIPVVRPPSRTPPPIPPRRSPRTPPPVPPARPRARQRADVDAEIDLYLMMGRGVTGGVIDTEKAHPPANPTPAAPSPAPSADPDAPNVQVQHEAPAVFYKQEDGTRLIVVVGFQAYYASLGKSTSFVDGQPTRKNIGDFHQIAGAQEGQPPPLPRGTQLPGYDKIGPGWLVKIHPVTVREPQNWVRDEYNFVLEADNTLETPEQLNAWLRSHGVAVYRDYFRDVFHW
jgi:hypothetical protein